MKKFLSLFLCAALLFGSFGCGSVDVEITDATAGEPIHAQREWSATRTYSDQNDDIRIDMTVFGYASDAHAFYVESHDYFELQIRVTNISDRVIRQFLPTDCHGISPAHNHEVNVDFSDGKGHRLASSVFGPQCPTAIQVWEIAPEETETFTMRLAAGEQTYNGDFDLPVDIYEPFYGIKLYGRDIYTKDDSIHEEHVCTFNGTVTFPYVLSEAEEVDRNDSSFSLTAELLVVYREPIPPATSSEPTIMITEPVATTTTPPIAMTEKPVLYLYPEKETEVFVKLDYKGELLCTYPAYEDGWHVLARPDGTLTNLADGNEYSYLFWDGKDNAEYDMSQGYCIKGEDTAAFLREILSEMGLTPREYNEFIVYWLPRMQNNAYNLITFQGSAYTDIAPLSISPAPDSMLRVFMAYRPLEEPIEVEAPTITPFIRSGFTVVEWGGTELP